MSAGEGTDKHEADRLMEQSEATVATARLIQTVEATLISIARLGDHLYDDVSRHAGGTKPHQLAAAKTAHALQDAIRALTRRALHEVDALKGEYAASQGVPDFSGGPESNAYWLGPGDGPDS